MPSIYDRNRKFTNKFENVCRSRDVKEIRLAFPFSSAFFSISFCIYSRNARVSLSLFLLKHTAIQSTVRIRHTEMLKLNFYKSLYLPNVLTSHSLLTIGFIWYCRFCVRYGWCLNVYLQILIYNDGQRFSRSFLADYCFIDLFIICVNWTHDFMLLRLGSWCLWYSLIEVHKQIKMWKVINENQWSFFFFFF